MIENTYPDRQGNQQVNYILEAQDTFVYKEMRDFPGKFGKKYYVITPEQKWIQLTGGQHTFFEKNTVASGTKITCEAYNNSYGTFVGLRFAKDTATPEVNTGTTATKGLPTLNAPTGMDTDTEMCMNQLLQNTDFKPWKEYAKDNVQQFTEAMTGIAEQTGTKLNPTVLPAAYKIYLTKL